jgi:hypothetical protein
MKSSILSIQGLIMMLVAAAVASPIALRSVDVDGVTLDGEQLDKRWGLIIVGVGILKSRRI